MALKLNLPDINPTTGTSGSTIKPITEGTPETVVADQKPKRSLFGALDDLGTTLVDSVSKGVSAVTQKEVSRLNKGAEASKTSEGDPEDQPGGIKKPDADKNFFERYRQELIIGGATVAGVVGLYLIFRD